MDYAHTVAGRLLFACACATAAIAAWLLFISVTVLPARDPGHVVFWRLVAAGMLALSALSVASVLRRSHHPAVRWLLVSLSPVAAAFGVYVIFRTFIVGSGGGHFEGYLVVIGAALVAHALTAGAHVASRFFSHS